MIPPSCLIPPSRPFRPATDVLEPPDPKWHMPSSYSYAHSFGGMDEARRACQIFLLCQRERSWSFPAWKWEVRPPIWGSFYGGLLDTYIRRADGAPTLEPMDRDALLVVSEEFVERVYACFLEESRV